MYDLLRWSGIDHYGPDWIAQRRDTEGVQFFTLDAERRGKATPTVEDIANDWYRMPFDALEKLRGPTVAQRQHRSDFKAEIDAPGNLVQIAGFLEQSQNAAHTLVCQVFLHHRSLQ